MAHFVRCRVLHVYHRMERGSNMFCSIPWATFLQLEVSRSAEEMGLGEFLKARGPKNQCFESAGPSKPSWEDLRLEVPLFFDSPQLWFLVLRKLGPRPKTTPLTILSISKVS